LTSWSPATSVRSIFRSLPPSASASGASGSGKTLLLRAIADLDPHHGEVSLDRASCSSLPAPDWRRSVALVMAESQWWSERVGDHFEHGVDGGWLEQLALPAAAMTWEVARCSTGERQRLGLLRTLMHEPAALSCWMNRPAISTRRAHCRVETLLDEYRRQRQAALCCGSATTPDRSSASLDAVSSCDDGKLERRSSRP
jgi:putative ABC transport system ATP-binding protein